MYSNAAGMIPVVQALLGKGAALGTVLAFMMAVIALSLPEMIILRKVLKPRLIGDFIGVVGFGILLVGYLFNLLPLEGDAGSYANWVWLTILSMLAILFLPRQFQVAVIENKSEQHLSKAIWLFPLYMLAINLFVLPIAFGGNLRFPDGSVDADTYVLTLPMAARQEGLALLVFIGGLSAATGMVIVETIALSTMVCNDLLMPVLLRMKGLRLAERRRQT